MLTMYINAWFEQYVGARYGLRLSYTRARPKYRIKTRDMI